MRGFVRIIDDRLYSILTAAPCILTYQQIRTYLVHDVPVAGPRDILKHKVVVTSVVHRARDTAPRILYVVEHSCKTYLPQDHKTQLSITANVLIFTNSLICDENENL